MYQLFYCILSILLKEKNMLHTNISYVAESTGKSLKLSIINAIMAHYYVCSIHLMISTRQIVRMSRTCMPAVGTVNGYDGYNGQ